MASGVQIPTDPILRKRIENFSILEDQKEIHKTCAIVLSSAGQPEKAIDHLKKYIACIFGDDTQRGAKDIIEQGREILEKESEKTYEVEEVEI